MVWIKQNKDGSTTRRNDCPIGGERLSDRADELVGTMKACYSKKGGINLIAKTCDIESSELRGESKINLQDGDALKLAHEIIYKITKKNFNSVISGKLST